MSQRAQAASAQKKTMATTSPRPTLSSILKAVNDGITEINQNLSRVHALQEATSELKLDMHAERTVIETALSSAKLAMELEIKLQDLRFREIYEQTLNEVLVWVDAPDEQAPSITRTVPSFERTARHHDLDIEGAIQRKVEDFRDDREAFLSVVYAQLASDPILCGHFLKKLHELHGDHYLAGLDPKRSLKHP